MTVKRKVLMGTTIIILGMQVVRPTHNRSTQPGNESINSVISVPDDVHMVLKTSCYDCHSNNTNYPWYAEVQPIGWLLAKHINAGKQELNFDEFASYSQRRRTSKIRAIKVSMEEASMPLSSYTMMHSDAVLSDTEKQLILHWTLETLDSLSNKKVQVGF